MHTVLILIQNLAKSDMTKKKKNKEVLIKAHEEKKNAQEEKKKNEELNQHGLIIDVFNF